MQSSLAQLARFVHSTHSAHVIVSHNQIYTNGLQVLATDDLLQIDTLLFGRKAQQSGLVAQGSSTHRVTPMLYQ